MAQASFGECNAVIRLSRSFSPLFSQRVDKYSWRCTWFEHFNSAINVLWVLPLRNILTRLEAVKHWVMLPFWGWGQFHREEFYIGDISLILPPSSIGSLQLSFCFFPSPPHLYKFDKCLLYFFPQPVFTLSITIILWTSSLQNRKNKLRSAGAVPHQYLWFKRPQIKWLETMYNYI